MFTKPHSRSNPTMSETISCTKTERPVIINEPTNVTVYQKLFNSNIPLKHSLCSFQSQTTKCQPS